MINPYEDSYDCHYCNAKGCLCPSRKLGDHLEECVPCDTCEGTGQISKRQLDKMAADYRADEAWKRAFKSAMIVLITLRFLVGF